MTLASACETGVFDTAVGSAEQLGFAAAFLTAGARSVVRTLWPVNDLASALLMFRALTLEAEQGVGFLEALALGVDGLRQASGADVAANLRALACIAAGESALDGIEAAAKQLGTRTDAPFAHPVFWAGVVVSGAG